MTDRHDIATINTTSLTTLVELLSPLAEAAPDAHVALGSDGVTVYRPTVEGQGVLIDIEERLAGHVPTLPVA